MKDEKERDRTFDQSQIYLYQSGAFPRDKARRDSTEDLRRSIAAAGPEKTRKISVSHCRVQLDQ
jgi:Tfp pilus assembly ATPase PilU